MALAIDRLVGLSHTKHVTYLCAVGESGCL
jgi:hypothetical protein